MALQKEVATAIQIFTPDLTLLILCSYHLGDKICLPYLSTIPNPPSGISACKMTALGRSNTV